MSSQASFETEIDNLLAREYHCNAKYPVAQSSCNNNHSSLLDTIDIYCLSLGRTTSNRNVAKPTLNPKLSELTLTRNVENPSFTRDVEELILTRKISKLPPTHYVAGPTLIR